MRLSHGCGSEAAGGLRFGRRSAEGACAAVLITNVDTVGSPTSARRVHWQLLCLEVLQT